jgi:hypothetical protein
MFVDVLSVFLSKGRISVKVADAVNILGQSRLATLGMLRDIQDGIVSLHDNTHGNHQAPKYSHGVGLDGLHWRERVLRLVMVLRPRLHGTRPLRHLTAEGVRMLQLRRGGIVLLVHIFVVGARV